MTISNQNNKDVFVGDGGTLIFAYTFKIFVDADLEVTIQDTSVTPQTEILLVLGADYTVSDAGNPSGGNVTLLLTGQLSAAPSATDNITIRRILPLTQETDYVENDPFPAESHEEALDRGTMVDQQIQETLDRAVVLAPNITGVSTILPTPLAGAPIGWDATATFLVNNPSTTNLSQIDATATPDFIGATSGDGVLRTGTGLSYVDGGDFVTLAVNATYATISANDGGTDITAAELENLTDGSNADALHTHASITNDQVKVDAGATRDFIGATAADGVIRAGASIAVADGGDFITLTVNEAAVDHDALLNFVADEHVAHTAVVLTAGTGLSGGGDISASRTFDVTADYSIITANDGATDVTAVELETLTDGSNADALHVHAAITAFLGLSDTPGTYAGSALFGVRVNAGATALEFAAVAAATNFLALTDTPASYVGQAGESVRVNVGETALEFFTPGAGGATLTLAVNQTTHGFVVGNWLRLTGATTYALAQSDSETNAEVAGVVSAVTDVDNFTLQFGGRVTGLAGLTAGTFHFVSASVAGAITATAPSGTTEVIKPVLLADTTTTGFLLNMRGNTITDSTSFTDSFVDGDLTAGVLTITHNLGRQFVQVQIFDNNDVLIIPDNVTLTDANTVTVDLLSFGTLTGTFHFVIMDSGATDNVVTPTFAQSFVNADLTAGILVVTHNLGNQYPQVQVYDDSDNLIQPDEVTGTDINTTTLDINSFGTITGTWRIVIAATGAFSTLSPTNTSFLQTFADGDLSSGILTVTHNLNTQYVQVVVYDNTGQVAVPDDITATSTLISTLDFTSFGTLVGNWNVVVLSAGISTSAGNNSFVLPFVDGDLTAGVLTVAHSLGQQFVQVQVYDNTDKLINPDDVTLTDSNNLDVDLSGFGTLTGTFRVVVLSSGSGLISTASDLSLAGQAADDTPFFDGTNWQSIGGNEKIKVVLFTRDTAVATGTQAIVGVGFRPSHITFFATTDQAGEASWGMDNLVDQSHCVADNHNAVANSWVRFQNASIKMTESGGNVYTGEVQSFDSDGFTISWVRASTPTGTVAVIATCYR